MKTSRQLHAREIIDHPRAGGSLTPSRTDHVGIEVDADDIEAAASQFDCDPSASAAGVEDARRGVRSDEVDLTVNVRSGCG
jgi:hypothetical protein